MINSCPYQYLGVVTLLHDIIAIVGLIGHYPSSFWIIRKREETFRQNTVAFVTLGRFDKIGF